MLEHNTKLLELDYESVYDIKNELEYVHIDTSNVTMLIIQLV